MEVRAFEDKPLSIAVMETEKYMVKIPKGAFAQVGSVVDNLFKAESVLTRLKDLVKTVRFKRAKPRSRQSLKNFSTCLATLSYGPEVINY